VDGLSRPRSTGVTLALISYNGALRVEETLRHIAEQEVPENIAWELIVVDNNSSDATQLIVSRSWPQRLQGRLKIVNEDRQGAIFARQRAIREARYEYLSFVDDDNWISQNWISEIFRLFESNPEVAIVSCPSEYAFPSEAPSHCKHVWGWLAVGSQVDTKGIIKQRPAAFWTAGCSFRLSAVDSISEENLQFCLTGRTAEKRSGGEDHELCMFLNMLGYGVFFADSISFKHAIPSARLTVSSIEQTLSESTRCHVVLEVYREFIRSGSAFRLFPWIVKETLGFTQAYLKYLVKLVVFQQEPLSPNRVGVLVRYGRIRGLFVHWKDISKARANIEFIAKSKSNK
tara:strand:+ start:174 stop:1205 length:1032 start_codon:yes stop_codon:yes gene_type:complete